MVAPGCIVMFVALNVVSMLEKLKGADWTFKVNVGLEVKVQELPAEGENVTPEDPDW